MSNLMQLQESATLAQKIEYNSSGNLHFVRFQDGAGGSVKI